MKDNIIEIDPYIIYFTHSKIRSKFTGCSKTIDESFEEIKSGITKIDCIPMITVITDGINYYSENNRRLYLFKLCADNGIIKSINVRLKYSDKYSNNTYSLKAKITMK